jgi:alpha-1,3/alpha-1,6-mannosyltransferase
LLYTPTEEHFGIVPCEAMIQGVPVIAISNGGPLETVEHEKTGFLLKNDKNQWYEKMKWIV